MAKVKEAIELLEKIHSKLKDTHEGILNGVDYFNEYDCEEYEAHFEALLDLLKDDTPVLASREWTRKDIEEWLDTFGNNLDGYGIANGKELMTKREEIVEEAAKACGCLKEKNEQDFATLDYMMQDVLRQNGAVYWNDISAKCDNWKQCASCSGAEN